MSTLDTAMSVAAALVSVGAIVCVIVSKMANTVEKDSQDYEAGLIHGERIGTAYRKGNLRRSAMYKKRNEVVTSKTHSAAYIEGFCVGLGKKIGAAGALRLC